METLSGTQRRDSSPSPDLEDEAGTRLAEDEKNKRLILEAIWAFVGPRLRARLIKGDFRLILVAIRFAGSKLKLLSSAFLHAHQLAAGPGVMLFTEATCRDLAGD